MLAKKCARSLGLSTLGAGSILILAKERGLIESVEQSLRTLQNAGLWISELDLHFKNFWAKRFKRDRIGQRNITYEGGGF
jgi:predicted nucleic acid-binding protein